MSLTASIEIYHKPSAILDSYGSRTQYAQVSIAIYDDLTGQRTNGNNCVVTYTISDGGNSAKITQTANIPGLQQIIYDGQIGQVMFNSAGRVVSSTLKEFNVVSVTGGSTTTPPVAPPASNLIISNVRVDKSESAQDAKDAQITVIATSNYLPIAYKLDNTLTSASPVFTGLSGGSHIITAVDASGNTASFTVFIPTVTNLLISDPSVKLPGGNISRWNAAFNPIVFTYQRRDFVVSGMEQNPADGNTRIIIDGDMRLVQKEDLIYIKTPACEGTFKVLAPYDAARLVIDLPYTFGSNTYVERSGFVNINRLRPYYKMLTRISFFDKLTGKASTITSSNRPDNEGKTRADISNFLQSLLRAKDDNDYAALNYRDENLSASYRVTYAQHWDDNTADGHTTAFINIEQPYYILYSARQLGEKNGGNMAAYVPFASVPNGIENAKWITDFIEPAYSNGYPFDIGFIYSEDLVGRSIYAEFIPLDINRNPLAGTTNTYLLNDDGSWLLNSDGSKYVIAKQSVAKVAVPGQLGLNRLLIQGPFADDVYYLNVTLKYDEGGTARTVTQTQTIRIDDAVEDQSVYLRWIGLNGSWNRNRRTA
ncbi:hypothetical protein D0C36_22065 [Mucilaginibacter conchicola]|uniref:Uncharacterized protein n=1 Tax=Mucilaginibacter conchicola TaxID=2303333 RepID=A0A372NNF1_9SPHI|nr:hypothetical protein [Mucilaginibacter conchicola]RFZ90472.1 hypothetical protein D0C36_22065 [Mucilaginibacter conchicola]